MGHCVEALVSRTVPLEAGIATLRHAHATPLGHGLSIVPITDELFDEITMHIGLTGPDPFPAEFYKLSQSLAEFTRQLSGYSPVIYLETDYFGGVGTQSAVVWQSRQIVIGPFKTDNEVPLADGAINQALRQIGIRRVEQGVVHPILRQFGIARGPIDEFDMVGLGRFRSNEDWIEGHW